jgi:hypothetical protein
MTCNLAAWDRALRFIAGAALLALGFGGAATGTLALAFKVLGAVALLTALVGICPAYLPFHFSTKRG